MLNVLLTFLIILILFLSVLWKSKKSEHGESFFDKEYTNTLKGLCSIIVIFVHIPVDKQNLLQDALGSFAYIGVTGFFLISAYGMQYGVEHKESYLKTFPVNRLVSLLVPNFVVNIAIVLVLCVFGKSVGLSQILGVNDYIKILLEYCLLFYIVNLLSRKFNLRAVIGDVILILWVCLSSLYLYLSKDGDVVSAQLGWCYERLGLVWGLVLIRHFAGIKQWLMKKQPVKWVISLIAAAILGVAYEINKEVWLWGEYLLKIVLGLSIIIFYFLTTVKIRLDNPVTRFLGNISYETYLSHGMVSSVVLLLFPDLMSGLYVGAVVGGTLLFSFLIHNLDKFIIVHLKKLFRC